MDANKRNLVLIGGVAVAVAAAVYITVDFPVGVEAASGAIVQAERYRGEALTADDIQTGDQAVVQLMQTDEFHKLINDPEFTALAASADYQAMHANPDFQALMANAAYRALQANADFQALHGNPDYRALSANADFHALQANKAYQALHANSAYQSLAANADFHALNANSAYRSLAANADFQKLGVQINRYLERKNRKTVSLNEAVLKTEQEGIDDEKSPEEEQLENKRDSRDKPIFPDTFYNDELLQITLDYISRLRNGSITVRK